MKKNLFILAVAAFAIFAFPSCSSIRHTAKTVDVTTTVTSRSAADLDVSQNKISYTFRPTKAQRRCGEKAVIRSAVAEALEINGKSDVLVGFQYEIKKTKNFFGRTNIKYVKVEGYPAKYKNIHAVTK